MISSEETSIGDWSADEGAADYGDYTDEKDSLKLAKTYAMFRKRFHVPSKWTSDAELVELVEHRYQTAQHQEAFTSIEDRLRALGYGEDNLRMTHDYLYYLLVDLLVAEGVPFITETDIAIMPDLKDLLNGKTPDLILKSNGTTRKKPLILDVFVGRSEKEMVEKRSKYGSMKISFDFSGITIGNYNAELNKVLSKTHVDYFHKQVLIFSAEYAYWMACLKIKKILFSKQDYAPIETLPVASPDFARAVAEFKVGLSAKAAAMANNDLV